MRIRILAQYAHIFILGTHDFQGVRALWLLGLQRMLHISTEPVRINEAFFSIFDEIDSVHLYKKIYLLYLYFTKSCSHDRSSNL